MDYDQAEAITISSDQIRTFNFFVVQLVTLKATQAYIDFNSPCCDLKAAQAYIDMWMYQRSTNPSTNRQDMQNRGTICTLPNIKFVR